MNYPETKTNSKKKILLVTRPIAPPWDEASKNFAYQLAINMPQFEFGLLTNGILKNLPQNIRQHAIYTSNHNDFIQKLKLVAKLPKIISSYDIVHCLFTPTKTNSLLLKKLLKNKKTIQTIATLREDLFSPKDLKKIMFGDVLIAYSEYSKNKLIKMGFDNTQHIYPGIDLDLYKPAEKDEALLNKLKVDKNDFIVTYPGEFVRLGATDDILEMIIQNADKLKENKIKIIFACRTKNSADQIKKEKIKKRLEKNHLEDLARLPETFITLEKMLNSSNVIIFPVREMRGKFDVPLAIVEAMSCAKPVVISDIPILREFSNKDNSVIIKIGDSKQLLEAILILRQDKEKSELIGQNARKFVEKNFDIKKIAEKYENIYNRA